MSSRWLSTLGRYVHVGYTLAVLIFLALPILCVVVMSFAPGRYLVFPFRKAPTLDAFTEVLGTLAIRESILVSLTISVAVTIVAVLFATAGALAFVRHKFPGSGFYQKAIFLPVFFPQSVLGLGSLLWFNLLGIPLDWKTAAVAQLVWIAPIVTLIIAIQVFGYDPALERAARDLGATRLVAFRRVTLPLLAPGIFSGALFAFLLSWVNFPISLFTSGVDTPVPVWLHTKMALAYAPTAPALGALIFGFSFILLLIPFYLMYRQHKE